MLNKKERGNCKKILDLLSPEDLFSLKTTVTNGKIATTTREETTDLIVDYSKSPEELLQRRKMTRDVLFKFLHSQGHRIPPSTDKEGLIQKIIQLLGEPIDKEVTSNQTQQVAIRNDSQNQHGSIRYGASEEPSNRLQLSIENKPLHRQQISIRNEASRIKEVSITNATVNIYSSNVQPEILGNSRSQSSHTSAIGTSSNSMYQNKVNENVSNTDLNLSLEFIKWYFPMINSGIQNPDNTEWSCNHFWPDCNLKFSVAGPRINIEETYNDGATTFSKLDYLVKGEGILFNVNDTPNGHRGTINPYGIAKLASCGTIHRFSNSVVSSNNVGLFKQLFGLIRDPSDNNRWKIKSTKLCLHLEDNISLDGLSDFNQNEFRLFFF